MKRAFVTGASGFVGPWLIRELLERGWSVVAGHHGEAGPEQAAATLGELREAVEWMPVDVCDGPGLVRSVRDAAPSAIFHLAGVSHVPSASADPAGALEVNVIGAARLLAAVNAMREAGEGDPLVLVIGSAMQYGAHDAAAMPLAESAEQRPFGAYAASKTAQEHVALATWRTEGTRVVATRSFNHSGPGQGTGFVVPRLVRDVLALRDRGGRELPVGNLDPVRDFLHVADVARAYALLAERGVPGEAYNVSSGTGVRVGDLVSRVLAVAGVDARLHPDPALQRPADVPLLVGDSSKLRAATGWAPQHSLDTIIEDVIRAATR